MLTFFKIIFLAGTGTVSLVFYTILAARKYALTETPLLITLYSALFILYIIAIIISQNQGNSQKSKLCVIATGALLFRIIMLFSPPSLSSDIHRYNWDGKVLAHGINPYRFPPQSPELDMLKDAAFSKIEHSETFSVYPPLAQITFAIAHLIAPGIYTLKILSAIFDIGTIILLFLLLKTLGKDPSGIIVYAWNPLAVIETAGSGHIDSQGIFFLMLCILLFYRKKQAKSALMLLCAGFSKPFILPTFVLLLKRPLKTYYPLCIFACAMLLPFFGALGNLIKSVAHYLYLWEGNGSFFAAMLFLTKSYTVAKTISFLMLFGIIAILIRKRVDFPKALFILIGTILLISPTVYPWYVLWILPFVCIFESLSWLVLSWSIFFSYGKLSWYVYVPFYAVGIYELSRHFFKIKNRKNTCI